MNKAVILHIIGWILTLEAAFMTLPAIVALIFREKSGYSFLITIAICLIIGLPLMLRNKKRNIFFSKEGFVSVALGWIVASLMGAIPFYISGAIPSYIDSLFEVISGFTTTGSSILADVEVLPKSMLFWRSFTHWIGGMGILVFLLAILPMSGGERIHILRAESPGPSIEKLVPKMKSTAILLYGIYIFLSLLQILLLLIGKTPLFDAITITFGTAGTGGFAIKNSSIGGYSFYTQSIVTLFMFLFGINFNIYYFLLFKKFRSAFKSEELRFYFLIVISAILMISINLGGVKNFIGSIQVAAFQVSSIITTTGFATADFNTWPTFSKFILIFLMFIGACAGSTGGGLKVSRIIILIKTIRKELSYLIHKRSVKILKFDGNKIEHEVVRSTNVYFVTYMFLFAIAVLLISLDNFDFTTTFTAVAATLNNIGPGLEVVGPMGNYSSFSDFSKVVMMFTMLAGRLELYPVLFLLSPGTWKK